MHSLRQLISTQNNTLETKINNNSSWKQIPADILENIATFIPDMKEQARLGSVSKHYRQIISSPHYSKFGLFTQHYLPNEGESHQRILRIDKVTAAHVRAGNQLLLIAITKMKGRAPLAEADSLVYKAMYRHGSPLAMQFVKMFSTLPGQCKLPYDIDELIESYTAQANKVLETEYKLYFSSKSALDKISSDLRNATNDWKQQVIDCLKAYHYCYYPPRNKRFSFNVVDHILNLARADRFQGRFNVLTFEEFDAAGFIGSNAPKADNAWYLGTDTQKEFRKLQQIIDHSFGDFKAEPKKRLFLK